MNRPQMIKEILERYVELNGNQKILLVQDALVRMGDLDLAEILHELKEGVAV